MRRIGTWLFALAVMLLVNQAAAQEKGHMKLQSAAEVEREVIGPDGRKEIKRFPAERVVPGTEVIFSTYYENTGPQPVERASISNPIPEHMLYKESSARADGAVITFSVDGGKSYAGPGDLYIQDETGRRFPALPSHYTHIRWAFENNLVPGQKGVVSFRAILK